MSGTVNAGPNGVLSAGGLYTPTPVKTGAYTAAPGDYVPVDTTGGAVTITLPTTPADQSMVTVRMVKQASGNAVTIAAGGADTFNTVGGAASLTLAALYQGVILQYSASIGVWYPIEVPGSTAGAGSAAVVVALTDAATITPNATLGNDFRVTVAGNRTIANPTSPRDGQGIRLWITQDATGSRTITWGAAFDFGTGGAPTLTTTANKTDLLRFVYNATLSKWCYESSSLGL